MSATATVRVLVADDNPTFRAGVDHLVRRSEGMELVASVADGRAALEGIKAHLPDIAVLDVNMPGLTGPQVVNELAIEGIATRAVVLSGHLDSATIRAVMLSGAAACLAKDSGPEKLRDTLLRVAAGETIVPPELGGIVQQRAQHNLPPAAPPGQPVAVPAPGRATQDTRPAAKQPAASAPAATPSALGGRGDSALGVVAPVLGVVAMIAIIAVVALSGGGDDEGDAPVTQSAPAGTVAPDEPVTAPATSDPGELPEGISR